MVKSENDDGIIAKILADVVKLLLDTSISGEDSKISQKRKVNEEETFPEKIKRQQFQEEDSTKSGPKRIYWRKMTAVQIVSLLQKIVMLFYDCYFGVWGKKKA